MRERDEANENFVATLAEEHNHYRPNPKPKPLIWGSSTHLISTPPMNATVRWPLYGGGSRQLHLLTMSRKKSTVARINKQQNTSLEGQNGNKNFDLNNE